jgi:nicotinamide-nucleotide amidase
MFIEQVIPALRAAGHVQGGIFSRTVKVSGLGESAVAERLQDLISQQLDPTIALYSRLGEVDVRLTTSAECQEQAMGKISACQTEIESRLAPYIYGIDDDTLAGALGRALLDKGLTLATAESCTGGLAGHLVTNEAGSSAYYRGGVVCYSNESKMELLEVSPDTLRSSGAVSEACVREMLRGVLMRFGAQVGLAITGVAGPDGGSDLKPVGTVYVAVGSSENHCVTRLSVRGNRMSIKERSAKEALRLLLVWVRDGSTTP